MAEVEKLVTESGEKGEDKPKAETRKLEPGADVAQPRARQAETKKLEMGGVEPEAALKPRGPSPHLGLSRQEMNWAAIAHASILVTVLLGLATGGLGVIVGVAIPAIIWYAYRGKSAYVVEQARQATVYQVAGIVGFLALVIVGAILLVLGWVISGILVAVLVGLVLIPFALLLTLLYVIGVVGLPIALIVYGCYGALEAHNGRPFRYRWSTDLIDRYEAQA